MNREEAMRAMISKPAAKPRPAPKPAAAASAAPSPAGAAATDAQRQQQQTSADTVAPGQPVATQGKPDEPQAPEQPGNRHVLALVIFIVLLGSFIGLIVRR